MFNSQSNTPRSDTQGSSYFFLLARAHGLDMQARRLYAQAETLINFGLAEVAVRENARAVELETKAECLRLQAQRAADMAHDASEMRAEGYGRSEIAAYLSRAYGTAVA